MADILHSEVIVIKKLTKKNIFHLGQIKFSFSLYALKIIKSQPILKNIRVFGFLKRDFEG